MTKTMNEGAGWVDACVNFANDQFKDDWREAALRAKALGVEKMLCVGGSLAGSERAAQISAEMPGLIWHTAGCHPHDAKHWLASKGRLKELAQGADCAAVGECGLDWERNLSSREEQIVAFEEQIEVAIDLGKPLFAHDRLAHGDVFPRLKEALSGGGKVLVHCFSYGPKEAQAYLEAGAFLSFSGWTLDAKRGAESRLALQICPLNRILIETDAPYLKPAAWMPAWDAPKRRSEPAAIPWIGAELARIRGVAPEELREACAQASQAFFGWGKRKPRVVLT